MTTNKIQQKKYSAERTNYQLVLPINYEVMIPEDDSVRLLSQICEELDYKELYSAYSPNGRNPVTEPKILFKVLTYAYMSFIYSSRRIESACRRDINFMWLLESEPVPDHRTINRFRKKRLGTAMEGLFGKSKSCATFSVSLTAQTERANSALCLLKSLRNRANQNSRRRLLCICFAQTKNSARKFMVAQTTATKRPLFSTSQGIWSY